MGSACYLETVTHRNVACCKVDEKTWDKERRHLSVALHWLVESTFAQSSCAYTFFESYCRVICIVQAPNARAYVDSLSISAEQLHNAET